MFEGRQMGWCKVMDTQSLLKDKILGYMHDNEKLVKRNSYQQLKSFGSHLRK